MDLCFHAQAREHRGVLAAYAARNLTAVASTALFFLAKGKLAEKESQLTATQQTLQSTEGNLATAKASITALENKLAAESQALANTKNQLASVRSEAYTSRQELSRTRQQLGQTRTRIVELEENAKELKNEKSNSALKHMLSDLVQFNYQKEKTPIFEVFKELSEEIDSSL